MKNKNIENIFGGVEKVTKNSVCIRDIEKRELVNMSKEYFFNTFL